MKMKELVLKRYKVRQHIVKLNNQIYDLKKAESLLDDMITYRALLLENTDEAKRFKRLNLDSRKEGLFNTKPKNGLKIEIPTIPEISN